MSSGAIGAGGSTAGGILGYIESQGSENAAAGDLQQALSNYQNATIPNIAEQQWNLAQEQSAGSLTPEQLQAAQMGSNAMAGINTNPAYTAAQMQALQSLQQLGAGGLTAQERANILSANQQAAGAGEAANAATVQSMNARGMGGSGASLAAQLANNQNAANMASQQGSSINAQAQNQALSAMSQAGSMAGQMQAQQFGQQAATAQAQNAINQFNTQNQQNTNAYNTQAANQAQAANLANLQNISNTNTSTQNQQQAHNTGLYQQQFGDEMQQAAGEASVLGAQSNFNQNQAANTASMYSGVGSGLGTMAGAFGSWEGGNIPGDMKPIPQQYAHGGEVSTLGMNSYADGGEVSIDELAPLALLLMNKGGKVPGYYDGATVEDPELSMPTMGGQFSSPQTTPSLGASTQLPAADPSLGPNMGASNFGVNTLQDPSLGQSIYGQQDPLAQVAAAKQKADAVKAAQTGAASYNNGAQAVLKQRAGQQLNSTMPSIPKMGSVGAPSSAQSSPGPVLSGQVTMTPQQQAASAAVLGSLLSGSAGNVRNPSSTNPLVFQGNGYSEGGAVAPNRYAAGVSPNRVNGHPQMSGGGAPQRDSRDQNSSAYSGNMASPMSSQMKALVDAKIAAMNHQAYSNGGEAQYDFRAGGKVPGKAPVPGDSPANDIVNARLSPGEIVVKRSVAQSGDEDKIMNFIKDTLNKKKAK